MLWTRPGVMGGQFCQSCPVGEMEILGHAVDQVGLGVMGRQFDQSCLRDEGWRFWDMQWTRAPGDEGFILFFYWPRIFSFSV